MKDTHSSLAPNITYNIKEFVSFSFFNLSRALFFALLKKNSPQENSFKRILKNELVNHAGKGKFYV